ncbi:MAG: tetratricopeptide repeat protein [Opitutaceae bacterium]
MCKSTATLAGLCVSLCISTLLCAADPARTPEGWIAAFREHSAPRPESAEQGDASTYNIDPGLRFRPLLHSLPDPTRWPELRRALTQAISEAPSDSPTHDRQKLHAARWLVDYLIGDKASVKSEIEGMIAAAKDASSHSPAAWALSGVQKSLDGNDRDADSQPELLKVFENYLSLLAPLDVDEVKRILVTEENLNHLKKVAEAGSAFSRRSQEIFATFERSKDAEEADKELAAARTEFESKTHTELKALGNLIENPLVQRYASVLMGHPDSPPPQDSIDTLVVPDLVTLVGAEKAEALLRSALRLGVALMFAETTEVATRRLTRKVVIEEMPHLKAASWGVVDPENPAELFRLFKKKYPDSSDSDFAYGQAVDAYLVWLVVEGNVQEAVELAKESVGEKVQHSLYRPLSLLEEKHPEHLWMFLIQLLSSSPHLDEWRRLNELAAKLDRQEELKTFISSLSRNGTLQGLGRFRVLQLQAEVDLSLDEVSSATEKYHALLTGLELAKDDLRERRAIACRLLELHRIRADAAGFEAVVRLFTDRLVADWKAKSTIEVISEAAEFADRLYELGASDEAARIDDTLATWIEDHDRHEAASNPGRPSDYRETRHIAERLVVRRFCTAVKQGRWKDASHLIEANSSWAGADLSDVLNETSGEKLASISIAFVQTSLQQGDRARARRILEAALVEAPGEDALYAAYLNLMGADARSLLEKLATADRYQERPLIWQARLQLDAGATDAAIATLERAIKIDPSDGETKGGNRMRVYAFMAEAMKAKNDATKAEFFTGVVKAIRHAELADRWFDLGNFTRAVALYREALALFQDAYCIQSRIAVRLAKENRMEEAIAHYRRAFELMPDSFGRVESHCFGCEHIFAGDQPQAIADEVFERLLQQDATKPQLYYLRGYLREEQERHAEAAALYRQAVTLDPLYLNAWRKLAVLAGKLNFAPQERDDLILKQLELDPGGRTGLPDLSSVADLPRLFHAIAAAKQAMVDLPSTEKLWPLPASAALRAKSRPSYFHYKQTGLRDFATVLEGHEFVRGLDNYLQALQRGTEM